MTGTADDRHSFREINPVQSLRTPSFEFSGIGRRAGLVEHDQQLEELTRGPGAKPVTDRLLELPPATLMDMSLVLDDEGEDLLEDARANAHEGKYDIALELLTEYLLNKPEHQEARYLRAFCMYRLDGQDQVAALRILRPLRDEPMPDDLRGQVGELRRELRRRLTPGEMDSYARTAGADPRGALERAEAFLELAPEEGSLSCLVALGQAKAGALELALDTATRGVAEADVDKEQVAALESRLLLQLARPAAAPAVAAFRAGDPRLARAELARMDARRRRHSVIADFDAYLALCVTSPRRAAPPAPNLPRDRADAVYSLIAEADGQTAAALLQAGLAEAAEQVLARVLPLVSGFSWLNFLYAVCLLHLGRDPDRAVACAEIAGRDATITQAGELLEAVRGWQEAAVVNPAVAEFVDAMKAANSGGSPHRLATLRNRLTGLQGRLPAVREAVRSEQGRQIVRELEKATVQRLAEVADAMAVGDLYNRYDAIMSPVKGGISDTATADRLARSLDDLDARISNQRRGTGKNGGRDPLDELAKLVTARRTEVARVKTALMVSDLVERFNNLVKPPPDPLSARFPFQPPTPDPYTMRTKLTGIRDEAQRLRRGHGAAMDPQHRKLLDELIGAISKVLG
ncbi:hypothetical protein [Streptomyces hokutonensis]|uniref:hypothetical protein n=1 Tax=Streptomyces hokutonensis TaxID=1306990 RepID=UPI0003773413|nr:hypothetical protein [Streptomyces hokutonensis]